MAPDLFIFLLPLVICAFAWLAPKIEPAENALLRKHRLEERINDLLPQTQCGKCDYAGCRAYARAIAWDQADINRCPPGGDETINLIATLLGRDSKSLDAAYTREDQACVARIEEQLCIGCVKCIKACPVDAIIGAPKHMHTVLRKACTGCELCLPPCPVDCISMVPVNVKIKKWIWTKPPAIWSNPDEA